MHLKQKARLRPELSPKFLSTLGPNPAQKAQPDLPLWFDEELRRLGKLKRKAYFKFFKKSEVFSKTDYNKIKIHYEGVIKTKKAKYYKEQLENYQTDARSLWITINKIVGKSCYKPPNCVKVYNRIVSDEQKRVDYFNTYFSSIAKKLTTQLSPPDQQKSSFKNFKTKNPFFFNPMTVSEIKRITVYIKFKTKKQFQARRFPSKATIRVLPEQVLETLAYIFNQPFVTDKFIETFKKTKVIPIYKIRNPFVFTKLQTDQFS